MSFSNNFPTTSPSLELDFANVNALDPRITFTRSSIATVTNSLGLLQTVQANVPRFDYDPVTLAPRGLLIEEQRTNLLAYSEYFDNITWTKARASINSNTIAAPDGSVSADKLVEDTTASNSHFVLQIASGLSVSTNYTWSICAKAGERNRILLTDGAGSGASAYFDLLSGTVVAFSLCTPAITNLGNGWYRCIMTFTTGVAQTSANCRTFLVLSGTNEIYTGDGVSGAFIWGAQLEAGAFATSYVPSTQTFTGRTSTGTFIGSNGLVQTAGVGVARMQYNPTNLNAQPFLLLEAAATNLLTYSEQFDNAVWTKSNASVTANAAVSPDGTTNADKLVENTATSTHTVSVTLIAGSAVYTYSVYVKASGRSVIRFRDSVNGVDGYFDLTTVSSPSGTAVNRTITDVGNGWYRCSMTSSSVVTNPEFGVRLATAVGTDNYTGDGVSGVFLYGSQVEANAFATSYIPTVATTVNRSADTSTSAATTRNADAASMTGTAFSSWYNASEGTLYGEAVFLGLGKGTSDGLVSLSNNSAAENIALFRTGSVNNIAGVMRDNSTDQASYTVAMGSQPVKAAFAYALNNSNFALNGAAQTTDTSCTLPTVDRMLVGSVYVGGDFPTNGHIRRIAYYPVRLSNTNLQALTL